MTAPGQAHASRRDSGVPATGPAGRIPDQAARLHPAQRAAEQVLSRHSMKVALPDNMGTITLPEPQRLAYYGGIVTLAALGVLEWPVAALLGIGHFLAEDHHHKVLAEFGEALAEA